ncbi:helix-turn-helix domain-containing protein [Pararhodospirillum oryzae]|uniref:Winged helix-turn-helix domain-containing protein n=1 Tax=Pararhodospirillum oryzae TaxID=478448 RepID=A0A512H7X2_9PROT|nr:helix-turn-helix domain-containing protein [Pararhodospirillum oryzae]GEO81555.1 hypothetical protein ROR02_16860 [Pararhodospirillum oryzae]
MPLSDRAFPALSPAAPFSPPRADTSQRDDLLSCLQDGAALTQGEAEARFGCRRLAARVWDLRQAGWPVRTRRIRDADGRLVAEYFLDDRKTPGLR